MLAILKARNSAGWLRAVAAKYGKPVVEVRRLLGTSHALHEEVAILLNDMARDEAIKLVSADGKAPQGDDLLSELTRRYHFALFADKKQKAREEARRAFAAEALEDSIRKGAK
jgi:hypothetical protein